MKVGIVSMDQVWENKDANKAYCNNVAEIAFKSNLDIIIFPELTLTGFSMNTKEISEKSLDSATIDFFKSLALRFKIGVVFGVCLNEYGAFKNCAVYISDEGVIEAVYRKIHPFTFSDENKYFSPGNKIVTFNVEGFTVGLSVCYDLRFPELYRLYTDSCQIVINIANWPKKRIVHWKILLKARAIENQFIMIGVNRTGIDGNHIKYIESSTVILPNGLRPPIINHECGLKSFEILPKIVREYRDSFPVLQDRRNLIHY